MTQETYNEEQQPVMNEIWLDMEQASEEVGLILDELYGIKNDYRIKQALGNDFLGRFQQRGVQIRKRMTDDFSIVVIGDFKRGKSTLINSLLKEQIVTTDVTPETVTINRISYGQDDSVEAVLKDSRRVRLAKEQLVRTNLDKLMESLPSEVEHIDIKVPLPELQGIRIVDTPGVGDLLRKFDDRVKEYLLHADAVIYVISALSPLSETEQTFLRAALLPQEFSKLILIVNMLDCLEEPDDISRIIERIESRVMLIFPYANVYGVSALDEYCRIKELDRPNPKLSPLLEESFDKMRSGIKENVITKHDMIQLQRVVTLLNFSIRELQNYIQLIKGTMDLEKKKIQELIEQYEDSNSDLMKRIDQHKESIKMDINEMQEEALGWMNEFLKRLEDEIRASYYKYPLEGIQKHFHFFVMDVVKEAINECVSAHVQRMAELLKNKTTSFISEFNLVNSTELAKSTVHDVSWTNIDNAVSALALAGELLPGLGMLVELGQLVLGFSKKTKEKDQRSQYIQSVLSNFPVICENIKGQLKTIYQNLIYKALGILDETYKKQIAASIEAIQQAQVIAQSTDQEKQTVIEGLDLAKTTAEEAQLRLEQLEAKFT